MLEIARERGFQPKFVLFDGWFASLENLKLIRGLGWKFLTRLKSNRLIHLEGGPPLPVTQQPISESGTVVWLPGFGMIKVFRLVAPNGDATHWATNDLDMNELERLKWADLSWSIEEYHRGLKQNTGVERCQCRSKRAQINHIGMAIRAFLRLEWHRFSSGISWFEAKMQIIRDAVRKYLENPLFNLPNNATALVLTPAYFDRRQIKRAMISICFHSSIFLNILCHIQHPVALNLLEQSNPTGKQP